MLRLEGAGYVSGGEFHARIHSVDQTVAAGVTRTDSKPTYRRGDAKLHRCAGVVPAARDGAQRHPLRLAGASPGHRPSAP